MPRRFLLCFVLACVSFGPAVALHAQSQYSTSTSQSGSGITGSLTEEIASGAQGFVETGSQLTNAVDRTYGGMETQGVAGGDAQRTFLGPGTEGGARSARDLANLQGLRQALSAGMFPQSGSRWQPGQSRGLDIRPTFTLGFAYKSKISPKIGNNVRACLGRIPNFGETSSIRMKIEKNVVVLEGTVARKSDRALASQLVALEPGVIKVDNRLKVAGTPSTTRAIVH